MRFADKMSLVAGIDAEISRAIAVAFAREGAGIVGGCRSADRGRETTLAIERIAERRS
jgi:NAD(P)-dependent dehydrogenase (short-subunit alcohol dehydrogenase family)